MADDFIRIHYINVHIFVIFALKPATKAELALSGLCELAIMRSAKPLALSQLAEKQAVYLS